MATIKAPECPQDGRTVSDEYRRWVFSTMPAMGDLLDALDNGGEFNFYAVMAAISQIVALYTKGDLIEGAGSMTFIEMSQKNCRFCC